MLNMFRVVFHSLSKAHNTVSAVYGVNPYAANVDNMVTS